MNAHEPSPAVPTSPPPSPPPERGAGGVFWATIIGVLVGGLVLGTLLGPKVWNAASHALHRHDAVTSADGKLQYYTCGMHPWVLLPKPGLCPVCHMNLEPIDPAKFDGKIAIDPVIVQNIGVRVEPVVNGPLMKSIRTVGTVDYAEPLVKDVNLKTSGWIEKLHVSQTGQLVKVGDPMFDLYSPDLYAAQEELLAAQRSGALGMIESARTKLSYFDVPDEQINAIIQAGKPTKTMSIRSPHTGAVIEKKAVEGMKIDAGTQVYRIADLSRVWVMVTVYEYQLPYLREGQTAIMSLPYLPGKTFEGKVVYVYPYLNEQVREVRVRLEFDNASGLLKPGMFANVELRSTLAEDRVLAPRSAIIDTGKRQVAFVSLGEGRFEPRDVHVGVETENGSVEIREGLKPGELVVTSGQFLIDSEANIRASLAKMIRGEMASEQKVEVASAGKSEVSALPAGASEALSKLLRAYLLAGDKLAADSASDLASPAREIAAGVDALLKTELSGKPHFWHEHDEAATVRGKALELIDAKDLTKARLIYADLSVALARLTRATGVPGALGKEIHQLHCPMYLEGQGGGTWLQPAGNVRNPFYGSRMLECFDRREALPVVGVIEGGAG